MSRQMDSTTSLDSFGRDRFELLSAYLDGEATAAERKQVQQWLDTDTEVQQLYRRLVKLRQGLQALPVPASEQSAEEMTRGVFRRIQQRRTQRAVVFGGGAIAALFVSVFSGLLPGSQGPSWRLAENREPAPSASVASSPVQSDTLMIAVNRPVVEIPKAPVAAELGNTNP